MIDIPNVTKFLDRAFGWSVEKDDLPVITITKLPHGWYLHLGNKHGVLAESLGTDLDVAFLGLDDEVAKL